MAIYFLTAVLTSHITLTYCDSSDSIQSDRSARERNHGTSNEDELLEVAENVVFRPYFNHNTHHGHGVASYSGVPHHHKHPNVAASHPYYVPPATHEVISLQNVDHGSIIDPKVQSNLIRRSYASASGGSHTYHSATPPVSASYPGQYYYYATSKPLSSANGLSYGHRPANAGTSSLAMPPIQNVKPVPSNNGYATGYKAGAAPQNCYCLPTNMPNVVAHHKTNPVDSYYQDYVKEVIAYYNNYYNQYGKP